MSEISSIAKPVLLIVSVCSTKLPRASLAEVARPAMTVSRTGAGASAARSRRPLILPRPVRVPFGSGDIERRVGHDPGSLLPYVTSRQICVPSPYSVGLRKPTGCSRTALIVAIRPAYKGATQLVPTNQ